MYIGFVGLGEVSPFTGIAVHVTPPLFVTNSPPAVKNLPPMVPDSMDKQ
jgi:hypothetical protein